MNTYILRNLFYPENVYCFWKSSVFTESNIYSTILCVNSDESIAALKTISYYEEKNLLLAKSVNMYPTRYPKTQDYILRICTLW